MNEEKGGKGRGMEGGRGREEKLIWIRKKGEDRRMEGVEVGYGNGRSVKGKCGMI